MAFVPAGYYEEGDEEDGFDFGDGYVQGQYEITKIEVSETADDAASLNRGDQLIVSTPSQSSVEASLDEDEAPVPTCGSTSSRVGEESLFSAECVSQASSSSLHDNSNRNNSGSSPVRFNISSQAESEDSVELGEDVVGTVPEPFGPRKGSSGRGASCDRVEERSKGRLIALEMAESMKIAVSRGNVEEVARLLDEGLDPNLPLSSGWPPLLHACETCQESTIKLLLDRGADPNSAKDLLSALMVLCLSKPQHLMDTGQGCARLLIGKGAKVNTHDRHHMSPLLYACQTGQVGLAELLIQSNADVNAKDVRGWTPLLYAASKGHTPLLRLLVKKGADPEATCNQHETPSSVAYASGHIAAGDWLESLSSSKVTCSEGNMTSDLPLHPLLSGNDASVTSDIRANHAQDHTSSPSQTTPTTTGDLDMFLLGLQLGHLTPLFEKHKVEFGQLLSMTDSDLQLMGVAQVGSRKKILNGVLEVHKREWIMPDSQLPYGRPISSAELTVILSNLSCHAHYLQGSTHFLLTHLRSNADLLGPHVEPDEAKKLTKKLSEAVVAVQELQRELTELQSVARHSLPVDCRQADAIGEGGHVTSLLPHWARERKSKTLLLLVIGVGAVSGVALSLKHFLTR